MRLLLGAWAFCIGGMLAACSDGDSESDAGAALDGGVSDADATRDGRGATPSDAARHDAGEPDGPARDAALMDRDSAQPEASMPGDARADTGVSASDACTGDRCAPGPPEPPGLEGITRAHNEFRAAHGLGDLAWNPSLAAAAQAEAESCRSDLVPNPAGFYRNFVAFNGFRGDPERAVGFWADGVDTLEDSGTCPDLKCLMYLQLLSEEITDVGCGVAQCDELQPSAIAGPFTVWLCHYTPR